MAPTSLKFGILSTADIANLIVKAINALPEAECYAVGSRDVNKAKNFAAEHQIPHACTYSELLLLPIDAVYIPLPTSLKANWAVLFAKAGKHVLVDKPLGSEKAVNDILRTCEESGVFFLDGTHFVHAARTKEIQRRISAGDIGSIRQIDASFSLPIWNQLENIRSDTGLEPQGFLGDLGWYCARAAVTFLGAEMASTIYSVTGRASFHPRKSDCIQGGSAVVEFGRRGEIVTSCLSFDSTCALRQRVSVIGELGILEISDFVLPLKESARFESIRSPEQFTTDTEYTYERSVKQVNGEDNFQIVFPREERIVVQEPGNVTHPALMIREFCRLIVENDKKAGKQWARESLATQRILDAVMSKVVDTNKED